MKKILIILTTGFLLFACEKTVEGLNDNPNEFKDSPINLLLNHSLLNVASIAEAETARFNYYVADNGLSLNTTDGFAAQTNSFPVISFEEVQLIVAETAVELKTMKQP